MKYKSRHNSSVEIEMRAAAASGWGILGPASGTTYFLGEKNVLCIN